MSDNQLLNHTSLKDYYFLEIDYTGDMMQITPY